MHRFLLYLSEIKLTDSTLIIVKLNGGLGNQLFQYALGRHLAEINRTGLKLDISWYKKGIRRYELEYFNIKEQVATPSDISSVVGTDKNFADFLNRKIIEPVMPYYRRRIVKEKQLGFDSNIFKVKHNVYLDGFWQSEKYFKPSEMILREILQFKYPLDERNLMIAKQILQVNAVSLHVRRGDYVQNAEFNRLLGTCNNEYYQNAIAVIESLVPNPHYFVFSDEMEWVIKNLGLPPATTYVHHNTHTDSYRDMQLMSLCQHHIVANSSFSWWGAWLGHNNEKNVVGPKQWVASPERFNPSITPTAWNIV